MLEMHCSDMSVRSTNPIAVSPREPIVLPGYDTKFVQLTGPREGTIEPTGYDYWSNINAHAGQPSLLIFIGRRGQNALLLEIDKASLRVVRTEDLPFGGTGEGWYWSKSQPFLLYVMQWPNLIQYDVSTRQILSTVFDVQSGQYIWQAHSSADDQVHSCMLRQDGTYAKLGSLVQRDGGQQVYPPVGVLDECQIDKSGEWLVIKEDDRNRIVNTVSGISWTIDNAAGALGHSDNGFGYMVGEDDMAPQPGAMRMWEFPTNDRGIVYHAHDWSPTSRHVSHCNAPGPFAVLSSFCPQNSPRANEIVTFKLDGSLLCRPIAPNLTGPAAGYSDYERLPKGNVCPSGEFYCWTASNGTNRLDLFLVRVP